MSILRWFGQITSLSDISARDDSYAVSYTHLDVYKRQQLEEAIRLVCQFNTASASFLQRKMSIGYARAARMLDQLEEMGIVGHAEGAKPRDVLVRNAEEFLNNLYNQQ